jgi:hypothetical protein
MACGNGDVCNPGNVPGPFCVNPCRDSCALRCCLRTGACESGVEDDACGNGGFVCDDCTQRGMVCRLENETRLCE